MTDRVALVTGASGGIGRASARALAADGMTVACGYGGNEAGAKETVRVIEDAGGRAAAFGADVTDAEEVRRLVKAVRDWAGSPTVLVISAGMNRDGLAIRYRVEDWDRMMAVNATGAFLTVQAALPGMLRARWGRIVLVSSVAAMRGNAGQTAYSAAKSAVLGMGRSLAREYGGRGITVNTVCPGFIETDMIASLLENERERLVEDIPAGRIGVPEDAAAAIRFLVSEDAAYVNGAVLVVDGGMTA